jgi:hypothetical protein
MSETIFQEGLSAWMLDLLESLRMALIGVRLNVFAALAALGLWAAPCWGIACQGTRCHLQGAVQGYTAGYTHASCRLWPGGASGQRSIEWVHPRKHTC